MKKLFMTLLSVLHFIAMPACWMGMIFVIVACDESSVTEEIVPFPAESSSSLDNKHASLLLSKKDNMEGDYENTGLPVCYISTIDGLPITSKTEYVEASLRIEQNGELLFEDTLLNIRGRGHSSWTDSPKVPYKLKLSHKAPLLGMSANKHFVLLSNYFDKSLMRAAIGFKIGELLESSWTPESRFVELVFNGKYQGDYQLTESVREGANRIRVDETGFLTEYIYPDRIAEEKVLIQTIDSGYYYKFMYPDEKNITARRVQYADNLMNRLERSLNRPSKPHEFADIIDVKSWAKWFYQQNLLMLEECNMYMVKYDDTENSRLAMGPMWDFDWCLGSGYYNGTERPNPNHHIVSTHYFRKLAADSLFMAEVARLHREYGPTVREGVLRYYDELMEHLRLSQRLNFACWPILTERVSIGAYPLGSWEREVACDRQFFLAHYEYLDQILIH
jgi:hypothetical protein